MKGRKHRPSSTAQSKRRRGHNEQQSPPASPTPQPPTREMASRVWLLDLLPSLNPPQEKERLERLGYAHWLMCLTERPHVVVVDLPGDQRTAILDIYRRCYEQAGRKKARAKILSDLATHFPTLCLCSPWPSALLEPEERKQTFRAVSAGLRRAANRTPDTVNSFLASREVKLTGVFAARGFAKSVGSELRAFDRELRDDLDQEEKRTRKARKILYECGSIHPHPAKKKQFIALVRAGKFYEAAVTLAATVFGIRVRDVRGNPFRLSR